MQTQSATNTAAQAREIAFLNKVWSDDLYRAQLRDDPKKALAEFGADVPDDVEVRLVMDTDKVVYFHIPDAPAEGEISDVELMAPVGGSTAGCFWLFGTGFGAVTFGISYGISKLVDS